jgi:hypothetical protein
VKPLRTLLVLLGLVGIAVAVAIPFQQVRTGSGYRCGTAWSAARTEVARSQTLNGLRIDVTSSCKPPAHRLLREAGAVGGAGLLLLLVVVAWPAPRWRAPDLSPSLQ